MLRFFAAFFALIFALMPLQAVAQMAADAPAIDRSATGGAQTLEDILRRQQGVQMDDSFRSDNIGGDALGVRLDGFAARDRLEVLLVRQRGGVARRCVGGVGV